MTSQLQTGHAPTIVIFGDSIDKNNDDGDANFLPGVAPPFFGATNSIGMFEQFLIRAEQPFRVISNASFGGSTTTIMLSRIQTDVIGKQPGYVFMGGGGNDLVGDPVISNLKTMYQMLSDAGIFVIDHTVLPRDTIQGIGQPAYSQYEAINEFRKDWWATHAGGICVDLFPYFLDYTSMPTSSTAMPNITYFLNDGGAHLHPNGVGAVLAGNALYRVLGNLFPPIRTQPFLNLAATGAPTTPPVGALGLLNANPLMLQGAGGTNSTGSTGTIAEGYFAGRTNGSGIQALGNAIVLRSSVGATFPGLFDDGRGGMLQQLNLDNTAGAITDSFSLYWSPGQVNSPSTLPTANSGPWIVECEVGVNMTTGTLVQCNLFTLLNNNTIIANAVNYDNTATSTNIGQLGQQKYYGVLRSRPFYMLNTPIANPLGLVGRLNFQLSAGGVGQAYIGNWQMRLVSPVSL